MDYRDVPTPAFVIDQKELDANIDGLREALDMYWPRHQIGYSVKTNSLPWLLSYMKKKLCRAEVVSSDEYAWAKCAGFLDSEIIFNGPVKGRAELESCIIAGGIANLDAQRELDWLEELGRSGIACRVGLRVNFDVESEVPGQIGYEQDGTRFGFSVEKGGLKKAIDRIAEMENVRLSGLHMHSTSKTRSVDVYRSLAWKAVEIAEEYELDLDYVDIGGGFFGGLPEKPSFKDYIKAIAEELSLKFDRESVTLVVEPGAAIIASPVRFISTVVDVKDLIKARHVIVDGSRSNIDPLHSKSGYSFRLLTEGAPFSSRQMISGFTCMESDRLMEIEGKPELAVGDRIVFERVGSYTMTLNPLFISWFPAVYVDDGASLICVRKRWVSEELFGIGNRATSE